MTGAARIVLFPGASLRLYVAGSSARLGGGGVHNPSAPGDFTLHCLPSAETLDLPLPGGTMAARIDAPDTDVTLGDGMGPVTLMGSCTARSLTLLSPLRLHQDLSRDP